MKPVLVLHGGAGAIPDELVLGKLEGIRKYLRDGKKFIENGGSALDAVVEAVRSMEYDENFNAGYGAVLNMDGVAEVEASLMEGKNLKSGSVTLLQDILNPISMARKVMEETNFAFIGGEGAMTFARTNNIDVLPQGSLVTELAELKLKEIKELKEKKAEEEPKEPGTVGAVCIDKDGNIAAATSTGGYTGKIPGRIADASLLGCGTYADNEIGGVSSTGHGESIMRYNLSQRILQRIAYSKVSAQEATEDVIKEMTQRLAGTGGAITIDKQGDIGIYFNTPRMVWGYVKDNEIKYGINPGESFIEDL